MSKSLTYTLITIAAIAIATVVILKNPAPATTDTDDNTSVTPNGMTQTNDNPNGPDYQPGRDTTQGKKMAFDVFLKQGVQGASYECTVHQIVSNSDTVGKVWIDSTKVHGEFSTVVQDMVITSNFTMVDGYSYSWSSMPSSGFKIKIPADSATSNPTGAGVAASQYGDYDCKPWTPAASKFSLPANIKFTEIKSQ